MSSEQIKLFSFEFNTSETLELLKTLLSDANFNYSYSEENFILSVKLTNDAKDLLVAFIESTGEGFNVVYDNEQT